MEEEEGEEKSQHTKMDLDKKALLIDIQLLESLFSMHIYQSTTALTLSSYLSFNPKEGEEKSQHNKMNLDKKALLIR